jgi:hypothetical protein
MSNRNWTTIDINVSIQIKHKRCQHVDSHKENPKTTRYDFPLKIGIAKYETNPEKYKVFAHHFENCFTSENEDANKLQDTDPTHKNQNQIKINSIFPCSSEEIKQIINWLANKRSPGQDLIINKIVKNLTLKSLAYLASLLLNA